MARRLALIAHDHKKVDIVAWATFNRDTLASFSLIATRHTARSGQGGTRGRALPRGSTIGAAA